MSESRAAAPDDRLRADLTEALVAVWSRHAEAAPASARTEIRDNVVTFRLTDAVHGFDRGPASASYKSDAALAVASVTGRRVTAFISSHDPDTDAATETFTLERRMFT